MLLLLKSTIKLIPSVESPDTSAIVVVDLTSNWKLETGAKFSRCIAMAKSTPPQLRMASK